MIMNTLETGPPRLVAEPATSHLPHAQRKRDENPITLLVSDVLPAEKVFEEEIVFRSISGVISATWNILRNFLTAIVVGVCFLAKELLETKFFPTIEWLASNVEMMPCLTWKS
tara:strand:+ start:3322 stop:3660 length:339 start_codon:yes stop_codon:yes gene_type:complete